MTQATDTPGKSAEWGLTMRMMMMEDDDGDNDHMNDKDDDAND